MTRLAAPAGVGPIFFSQATTALGNLTATCRALRSLALMVPYGTTRENVPSSWLQWSARGAHLTVPSAALVTRVANDGASLALPAWNKARNRLA